MTKNLIEEAIVVCWGERCNPPAPEGIRCPTCQAWAEYDALALRGAETQWRPISEYDNNDYATGVFVRMLNGGHRWLLRVALCDRVDFTHFIPLTALGEPKP